MSRLTTAASLLVLLTGISPSALARDEKEALALVDKAIKAVGGEEAIGKIKVATWKAKGTISIMGNDNEMTTQVTMQGLDNYRQEMDGEFNGNKIHGVTAVSGEKGFRAFGDNHTDLDKDALANTKRTIYLQVIPVTLTALKSKDFKLDTIPDDKVGDKPVAGINVTGPDKKEFKLYFDKETGLPAKMVAKVAGFGGMGEFTQETTFSDYKEMAGIKKATKIVSKRDGEKFLEQTITEFKALDKVDPKTFTDAL
jgi:hypothetical protein